MMVLKRVILMAAVVLMISGCAGDQTNPPRSPEAIEAGLDEIMENLIDGQYFDSAWQGKSAVLKIDRSTDDFHYEKAVGTANYGSEAAMTVDHQFMISSITKTFVATLVLQLWEEGAFGENGLDSTLSELGLFDPAVLEVLHVYEGVTYGPDITLRQLLTHYTGLGTGWAGLMPDGVTGLGDVFTGHFECYLDPDCDTASLATSRTWARWDPARPFDADAGLFNNFISAQRQASTAVAKPGEMHTYRDLNFWILAIVVQELTDQPLYKAFRERIFDPLGMDNTYMNYTQDPEEDAHRVALSDFYAGDVPVITSGFNFSMDWAGGGLATTVEELSRFHRALIDGRLFRHPETYDEMRKWHGEPLVEEGYTEHVGLGYFTTDVAGVPLDGHTGFMGAFMFHDAETDTLLSGTINKIPDEIFFVIIGDILRVLDGQTVVHSSTDLDAQTTSTN